MKTPAKENYPIRTIENAEENAKPYLENVKKAFGGVPNIIGVMANAPVALQSYMQLAGSFAASNFDATEQQVIFLTISEENSCSYCSAAHSTALKKKLRADPALVDAIRDGGDVGNPKLGALIEVVRQLVKGKGRVSEAARQEFYEVGYTSKQLIELLPALAMKTITNYLDHFAEIELDAGYRSELRD